MNKNNYKKSLQKLLLAFAGFTSLSLHGQNLITNGSFESGITTDWNNLAGDNGTATFSSTTGDAAEGTTALKVEVTLKGTNPWSIQSLHTTTPLIAAQPHTLTFYAKSDSDRTLNVVVQNEQYLATQVKLSTTWTKYTWNFTSAETSPMLRLQFPEVGTYYIDNIVLVNLSVVGDLKIDVTPTTNYQTMVGFGGALTWYCDLITKNNKKTEIVDLLFNDLGTDIVRFKNWYYPSGYPAEKSTATMEESYFKGHFDATNELYALGKQANPNLEVLLSSWTPPSAYKSNSAQNMGTLKKENDKFIYNKLGAYYKDVLDSIKFNPDYFSFQNEPGYANANWATCEWRPTETTEFPGYDKGLDSVYQAIKDRSFVPKIIGPETENIGNAVWDNTLNTFTSMTTPVATKPYLHAYAYHLYNYAGSPNNVGPVGLNTIKSNFGDKPNFMTEFSSENFDWLQTADAIHQTVVEANASAYIYWELMWEAASKNALIKIDDTTGNYSVGNHYYALKHYSKHVNKGYQRIAIAGGNSLTKISGYLNPARNEITLVALNNNVNSQGINLNLGAHVVSDASAYQSVAGNFYQSLGAVNTTQLQTLPAKSITTYVIKLEEVVSVSDELAIGEEALKAYPNPFESNIKVDVNGAFAYELFDLAGSSLEKGTGSNQSAIGAALPKGTYLLKVRQDDHTRVVKVCKN